jgi:3-phytase/alkaline phosphatase D
MAVLSRYPIDEDNIRTFQNFLWKDMPGAMLPRNPDGSSFYTPEALAIFRLSSKNHWDVPILVDGKTVHFLTSHPTPPVFDDPVIDQNGTRNNDEIRFWADYVIPSRSGYIYDDDGNYGGITPGDPFVIAGDQNSDPFDGDSVPGSIDQLLEHPLVNTKVTPDSEGGPEQAVIQDENNDDHIGDPAFDTADFSEETFGGPGNLRADYVLPRKQLQITAAGVFWPTTDDPLFRLTGGGFPVVSSDHRLVWVDVRVPSN